LLYECGPMGFICEMAGGRASTGQVDIKDVVPTRLHQRCSIYLGRVWVSGFSLVPDIKDVVPTRLHR